MRIVQSIIVLLVAALLVGLIGSSAVQGQDLLAHKSPTASKTPTVRATPKVKHLQVKTPGKGILATSPKPTVKATVKPTAKVTVKPTKGAQPTPTLAPTALVSASPTPPPGGYTPRFPGEPGYKAPAPTVKHLITLPEMKGMQVMRGGSYGTSGAVPLNDYRRYAGKGPGLVNGQVFPRPPDAPAPFSKPLPSTKAK